MLAVDGCGLFDVGDGGVCHGPVVDLAGDSRRGERVLEAVREAEPCHPRVRHQQRRRDAMLGEKLGDLLDGVCDLGLKVGQDG